MAHHAPRTLPRSILPQRQLPSLLPATRHHLPSLCFTRSLSASPCYAAQKGTPRRRTRDGNRNRGVSPMRHTGLREPLSVSKYPLPKPVLDPALRDAPLTDENHGLWGFFNKERTRLSSATADEAHGRAWRPEELRSKSWEDLHGLWWVCVKERNRLATEQVERERVRADFGAQEARGRAEAVLETQRAIKHVLTERWLAWENARVEATEDATVDLTGDGAAFKPFLQEEGDEKPRRDPNAPVEI